MMRRSSLASLIAVVICPSVVLASGGNVLFEQTPAPPEMLLQAASQEFPDSPSFTIFAADDFSVDAEMGWSVESLHSFFSTGNGSGIPADGVRWIIYDDDGGEGLPGTELLNIVGGDYDVETGLADIDLNDLDGALELDPGDYWFTSQIIAPIGTFGQEFHLGSLDGEGSGNFQWLNPGGGFELPNEGWNDAFGLGLSDTSNLAFQIGGMVIPEPATVGLLALAAVALMSRRRRD